MRIVALIATYNERRFIGSCLEHLGEQGIGTYLIDNCSTDNTVALAEAQGGDALIGIESFPRADGDVYTWRSLLERKEELSRELDADWFIHVDADELRLPPSRQETLAEALGRVEREGFNAVDFDEFTFLPTREEPDHDHADFQKTLCSYYPFLPRSPHKLTAWKASHGVELASSGGHRVSFPGIRRYPEPFPMKHYLFLSVPHAIEKYVQRNYDPAEVDSGWHGWRAGLTEADIRLPSRTELRTCTADDALDASEPRKTHYIEEALSLGK